ncbi:MAG: hypothetical protein AVDCRST_MAG85-898, partial [uncultured Solirubrobacteraceae bacterium]
AATHRPSDRPGHRRSRPGDRRREDVRAGRAGGHRVGPPDARRDQGGPHGTPTRGSGARRADRLDGRRARRPGEAGPLRPGATGRPLGRATRHRPALLAHEDRRRRGREAPHVRRRHESRPRGAEAHRARPAQSRRLDAHPDRPRALAARRPRLHGPDRHLGAEMEGVERPRHHEAPSAEAPDRPGADRAGARGLARLEGADAGAARDRRLLGRRLRERDAARALARDRARRPEGPRRREARARPRDRRDRPGRRVHRLLGREVRVLAGAPGHAHPALRSGVEGRAAQPAVPGLRLRPRQHVGRRGDGPQRARPGPARRGVAHGRRGRPLARARGDPLPRRQRRGHAPRPPHRLRRARTPAL